ncbi:MAG: F0F1 ATP synthase subunit delta [Clostridia bacterium]|nr:F0F1 ATP synthase subunit delta [Clostridia bacterium]
MSRAILQVAPGTSEETVAGICASFRDLLQQEVVFTVKEKPELIGGFIAEVDGKVYDNSLSGKMQALKKWMLGDM